MKLFHRSLALATLAAFAIAPALLADVNTAPGGNATSPSGSSATTALTAVGPHSRSWMITAVRQTAVGTVTNVSSVQEIATGLNFWDGAQWSPSDCTFQMAQDQNSAFVNQTQHKVTIAANLFVTNAVSVITPDGLTLNSSPLGIGLYDSASGAFSLIGAITNCTGWLVGTNQVVFSNAFCGVCADVVYTVEKGSLHQDVVITGKLDPADWGYPDNSTRIQVITELYNPPALTSVSQPLYLEQNQTVRSQMASPDLIDQVLNIGQFRFGTGRAYTAASADLNRTGGALVAKQVFVVGQRTLLVESVPYLWLQAELQSLPTCQSPGTGSQGTMLNAPRGKTAYAAIPAPQRNTSTAAIIRRTSGRLAGVPAKRPAGVVIDYEATISGAFSGPFESDATFFISGPVYCSNNVTIEGGAVFKFPYAGNCDIEIDGGLTLLTPSYRPAVFTAADDNTVGSVLTTNIWSGYTGLIQGNNYANPALYLNTSNAIALGNIRVNYAGQAVSINAMNQSNTWTISDSQFLNCAQGLALHSSTSAVVRVNNCLMDNLPTVLLDPTGSSSNKFLFCQTTIDTTTNIVSSSGSPSLFFTNCVLANATNSTTGFTGDHNGFYHASQFGTAQNVSSVYPYQTIGAGNYYLLNGSPFRDYGSPNIDPGLLADLAQKTTYPPIVFADEYFYFPLTLFPQAQRDKSGSPDIGWHYNPIDYAFGDVYLTNATLTAVPGAVIGAFSTNVPSYGLAIGEGGQLWCQGSPTNLCRIVNYNTVQEQPTTNWTTPIDGLIIPNFTSNGPNAVINCRFTDFSVMAQDATLVWGNNSGAAGPVGLQDCQLHGGLLAGTENMVFLTNCLLERVAATYNWTDGTNPLYVRNCLFWNGSLSFLRGSTPTNAVIEDTMFDHTTISDRSATGYMGGHNGYVTNCNKLTQLGSDVILSNSVYLTSYYGNYYIPTNSLLVHVGSVLASSLQLYHYTMWTNQVIEGTNVVSIGYHYVAANTNGMPLDTTGTGVPDYIKDANGNGVVDSGEINWTNANDLGLKVIITQPGTIPQFLNCLLL